MVRDVSSCRPQDNARTVLALMRARQIHRIPVVEDDGRLVGIVTLNDLARATDADANEIASAVAAIATPRRGDGTTWS
jgi:CBS domain-containing protein